MKGRYSAKPEEYETLTPYERAILDELRMMRVAAQEINKIWERMTHDN